MLPKYEQIFVAKGELVQYPLSSQNGCESYRSPKMSYEIFFRETSDNTQNSKHNIVTSKKYGHD